MNFYSIGKGFGRLMWTHFMNWCRHNGIQTIQWVTSPQAAAFYTKLGAVRLEDTLSQIDGRPIPRFTLELQEDA